MKVNINVHSAASAYGLVKGDTNFSEFFSCCYVGSWQFVVLCQHVVKSGDGDLIVTFKN
jgi:hypothetical protein